MKNIEKQSIFQEIEGKIATIEIHSDIGRKLRFNQKCLSKLKAEEVKKSILKVLFVVMHDKMSPDSQMFWANFRKTVLFALKPKPSEVELRYIKSKSSKLVQEMEDCYGESSITMKAHQLGHIPHFVEEFETLSTYQAFDFENYLSFLRDLIHAKTNLDSAFAFSSNLNFFMNLAREENEHPILCNSIPAKEENIRFDRKIVLNSAEKLELRNCFGRSISKSNNGQLSSKYGEMGLGKIS